MVYVLSLKGYGVKKNPNPNICDHCDQCTSPVKNGFGIQNVLRIGGNKFQLKCKAYTEEQIICYGVSWNSQPTTNPRSTHTPPKNVLQQIPNKNNFSQKMSLERRKIPAFFGQLCRSELVNSHKLQLLPLTQSITITPGWWREEQGYFHLPYVTNSSVLQIKWNKAL